MKSTHKDSDNLILAALFYTWLMSIPFYQISVVSTLSVDNLIAPLLLLILSIRVFLYRGQRHIGQLYFYILMYSIFTIGIWVSAIDDQRVFTSVVLETCKSSLYFLIPLLYIDSHKKIGRVHLVVIFMLSVGAISAILVSTGNLTLETVRSSESRIGVEGLQKSIGLLSNYGDLAMLCSFSLLIAMFSDQFKRKNMVLHWLAVLLIATLVTVGIAGSQSRNMMLTVLTGVAGYLYFRAISRTSLTSAIIISTLVLVGGTILFVIYIQAGLDLVQFASEIGRTREASATVVARLEQYSFAWTVISSNPVLGDAGLIYSTGIKVHNMWLNILTQGGLISFIAMFVLFISIYINLFKGSRTYNNRIVYMAQLTAVLMAIEFYGGLTYIYYVVFGIIAAYSTLRAPRPLVNADRI